MDRYKFNFLSFQMRWMVQDNINRFLGICVLPAPDNCFYHTSEFCSKGTLKSILSKDDINLDLSFKMSFIQDLARGMQYLHNSEIKSHGLLCSTLCFIDSRWVLKISGFGSISFQMFKENVVTKADPEARFSKMVWTSPELLRQELPPKGSVKGDVYSFGIMIHEIMTRTVPYSNFQTSSKETIRRVMKREEPPFRPDTGQEEPLEKDSILAELINLKRLCWEELPEHRPDFTIVRQRLRSMQKGHKNLNIMDNMLSKMEKYTENLEKVVANRTEQLLEEKKKTDALLYRMLPQVVADELKKGSTFPGEFFDEVTIYFSDIVRFTDLSAESSPMQVVDLLNDLYTCFDAIIEKFDVYKVETIGDAYMVVSGLPNRNGQKHASEIASMALDIRNAVKGFRVRHRPDHQLQIRIGINSGPVCAGVVGLTMPRFCLFGDTVNTASRMESNSLPQKIHVSYPAAKLLTQLGGYCLDHRGELAVKGKGIMHTFWLIGRQDTCTSHENHNMMAGKKLSTETLASIDSLLSPSGNGAIPNHQMEQRPTSKTSAESDGKTDFVNITKVGESTTDSEGQNKSKDDINNLSTIRISEGDQSKDNIEEDVRTTVKQTDSNSNEYGDYNINKDNTVQDLTNRKPVHRDQHQTKESEIVFSKVSFQDISPKKQQQNICDERSAKSNLQNNERSTARSVSRNNKLHKLLGEKDYQSFEEGVSPKQGVKKQAEVKSNCRTKSTKLETKHEINKNGSCHSVQSLEKISPFDNRSFNGSTPFLHDSPTKQKKSKESMTPNGEVPISTPRINIDAVS
ncbi:Atrial natriuretic peptide receptor 2 [Holothuria leucospilota]|uniref:Guanylate cyclase n=1 Tax=Holothuria leucospilota TaxID=206669 RepID=A0A9Q0YPW8_HOLLE|nr:Atrial natriuretic peptide receptor 2 [Holothuria leucospilota]